MLILATFYSQWEVVVVRLVEADLAVVEAVVVASTVMDTVVLHLASRLVCSVYPFICCV